MTSEYPRHLIGIVLVGAILATLTSTAVAENKRRDGNWWRQQSRTSKLDYVTGLFDGIDLGEQFTWRGVVDTNDITCSSKAFRSAAANEDKYMSHVTVGQVTDGLDSFYEDYRNRSIHVSKAFWIVLNSIRGTPQPELDKMIEENRKVAQQD